MIIVEGMDNSGKTTLVQRLSEHLKLLVMNNRRRPQSAEDVLFYVDGVVPLARRFPTILDRFAPISEPIYGPICRNSHLLTKPEVENCLADITKYTKPLVIYCRPPDSTILKFGEIEQMEGVIDHAPELIEAYDRSMTIIGTYWFPVIKWDWTNPNFDTLVSQIKSHQGI